MKRFIKLLIPKFLLAHYHLLLAVAANVWYGFPSRGMTVIGVTGTNGKTTTVHLIAHILERAGYVVGMTSTVRFKIGEKEWANATKQGMQGRFRLQRLLKEMKDAKCTHAVIETTSEGIAQYRHWGIDYDIGILTNLTPEHIESHGSFEKYKEAKGELFKMLAGKGSTKRAVSIVNIDDEHAQYFLAFPVRVHIGYATNRSREKSSIRLDKKLRAEHIVTGPSGTSFFLGGMTFTLPMFGDFNVYNALAAIACCQALGVSNQIIQGALQSFSGVPGRMELFRSPNGFSVVVDYAHDPQALENVYRTVRAMAQSGNLICVLGAVGGGRDRAKRPEMGRLAYEYCNSVFLTNEDPYDDDPLGIIRDVESGLRHTMELKKNGQLGGYVIIEDRKQAIQRAIAEAMPGDAVVVTGKGAEEYIMGPNGQKISHDDRKIVREFLNS